jgi:hypothetical protein
MTDNQINRIVLIICAILTALCLIAAAARGDDDRDRDKHDSDHNYIIERQQAYQVEGVPTGRIIDGRREIDIYSNGQMFEGNHLVGQKGDDDDHR